MSEVIQAAQARRAAGAVQAEARLEWFGNEVMAGANLNLKQRMEIVTEYLRSKTVTNISRPVTKTKGKRSGRIVVTNRSKSGEFPKADTTQLLKSIAKDVKVVSQDIVDGYIGTPLDYGLILETSKRLNRSFLTRTFREERGRVVQMLTGRV